MTKKQIATKKTKPKGKGKQPVVEPEIEGSDEDFNADFDAELNEEFVGEPLMADAGAGKHKKPLRRTSKQVQRDERKAWAESFKDKSGKCERQVDAVDLKDRNGVQVIRREGLLQWLEPLTGYNMGCVKEFYLGLGVVRVDGSNLPVKIKSKVANKPILVTPDDIAKYLNYKRPDPDTINYPGREFEDSAISSLLYEDPEKGLRPIKPSRFHDDIRILNKAIHANLYPKGKDTSPKAKSAEILAAFVDEGTIADWALFIFTQMIDFAEIASTAASMWFPCMITELCRKQGVKGAAYTKMESLKPGVLDMSTLHQSKGQSKLETGKKSKDGATSSKSIHDLFKSPKKGSNVTTWFKKLLKCGHAVFKKQEKLDRKHERLERKQERADRRQRRIEAKTDWLIEQQGASSGARFATPPELEDPGEEFEEEIEEEDDDDELESDEE